MPACGFCHHIRQALVSGNLRRTLDAIDTSARTREDVFLPLNSDVRPEHFAEKVELHCAKSLALGCGDADRAVILNEREAPFAAGLDPVDATREA
jgi:hypothetical protein